MKIIRRNGVTFYFNVDEETADRFDDVAQGVQNFPSSDYRFKLCSLSGQTTDEKTPGVEEEINPIPR